MVGEENIQTCNAEFNGRRIHTLKSTTCTRVHKKQLCSKDFFISIGFDAVVGVPTTAAAAALATAVESLPFRFVGYSSYSSIHFKW